jgi:ATP-dependent RNA helicase DeaD
VVQEAELLCGPAGLRTVAVYGGVGYGPQIDALRKGAHIVVGTPGRVLDHLLKRTFTLEHL